MDTKQETGKEQCEEQKAGEDQGIETGNRSSEQKQGNRELFSEQNRKQEQGMEARNRN